MAYAKKPKEEKIRAIEIVAEIGKVSTLSDGTVQITLNLPEYCNEQGAWALINIKQAVRVLMELD